MVLMIKECVEKMDDGTVVVVIGVDYIAGVSRIYRDNFVVVENDVKIVELNVVFEGVLDFMGVCVVLV